MNLIDKMKEKAKQLKEKTEKEAPEKGSEGQNTAGTKPEHDFLDAVIEEKRAEKGNGQASDEVTAEEVFQELTRRRERGELPKNPMEALMEALGKRPSSEVFATGAVFDLSRKYRDHYIKALQASNVPEVFGLFRSTYALFLDQPEVIGMNQNMFNRNSADTDPLKWNAGLSSGRGGDSIALCYMPVQSEKISARIFGIIFNQSGDEKKDGYYFCMLNKAPQTRESEVLRNTGSAPHQKIGTIKGSGVDLMNAFLDCINADYYGKEE